MIQTIHMFCMLILAGIGFFCSAKLSDEHPLWVRLIVLSPALMALATLAAIVMDIVMNVIFEPLYQFTGVITWCVPSLPGGQRSLKFISSLGMSTLY